MSSSVKPSPFAIADKTSVVPVRLPDSVGGFISLAQASLSDGLNS